MNLEFSLAVFNDRWEPKDRPQALEVYHAEMDALLKEAATVERLACQRIAEEFYEEYAAEMVSSVIDKTSSATAAGVAKGIELRIISRGEHAARQ